MDLLLAQGIDKVKARFSLTQANNNVEVAADWCWSTEGINWTPQSLNLSSRGPAPRQESPPPTQYTSNSIVPPHKSILIGSTVAIILKEDQASGKTIVGEVKDVLTRANHPRGVKVRLEDGRVGRVVGIVKH